MMVTWVRGSFKNIHGTLDFDPGDPAKLSFQVEIDASTLWTGEQARDDHLRSADFLDVARFPTITYKSTSARCVSAHELLVDGELTLHGVTRSVPLEVTYVGQWDTPWWEDGINKGPKRRAGFVARARIDRHDFGVNWSEALPQGGVVVSPEVELRIDAEAIRQEMIA